MKVLSLIVLAILISLSAMAAPSRSQFVCVGEEEDIEVLMSFVILNLEDPKSLTGEYLLDESGDQDRQSPIFFKYRKKGATRWNTPRVDPYNHVRTAALNGGDASDFELVIDSERRIQLNISAGDSCVDAELALYKNSGFTKGYLRSKNNCDPSGKDKSYSTVSCSIKSL